MNSRNSLNETNLVNFSADLTTLNTLDTKEPLLSFPFDHLYACHSDSSDRRQTLDLDKEVEISTHCVLPVEKNVSERLASLENQNKKLKNLLIYHLDLIQQQNDLITKKEKVYQALKQENDALKKVTLERKLPPITSTVTSSMKTDVVSISTIYDNFMEQLLPNNQVNNKVNKKPVPQEPLELVRRRINESTEAIRPRSLQTEAVATIIEPTMVENKRVLKKEPKPETTREPQYTITTNSGNPIIQRIPKSRKRSTGIGSLSRLPKAPPKTETTNASNTFEDTRFGISKKSKMFNTYSKSRIGSSRYGLTGSLSDRLQLIDTTPTGEDPYQLGEAEMRAQSPIPRLMLQKNHGRTSTFGGVTSTTTSTTASRRIYDTMNDGIPKPQRANRFGTNQRVKKEPVRTPVRTPMIEDPDLDLIKTEPEIDWRVYSPETPRELSVCDFSYGETTANLATDMLPLTMEDTNFFVLSPANAGSALAEIAPATTTEKPGADKTKKKGNRTTSLAGQCEEAILEVRRGAEAKRGGRRRAHSTASTSKRDTVPKGQPKTKIPKTDKAGCRGKKSPLPNLTTQEAYFTQLGDPDLSWYFGLDPDVKREDVEQISEPSASNVEVPRWREKPYTSLYSLEGTENLDDKVFEKRHQKLEAEERRQLRWHMRRIREQRQVERLRQRQRDPWGPSTSQANNTPTEYTVWPQPLRDLKFIEITDTLPVMALGWDVPAMPDAYFVLPWVRTSKAQKRSKRSKTLH